MTFVQYYKKYTKKLLTITLSLFYVAVHLLEGQTPDFSYSLDKNCAPTGVTFINKSDMSQGYEFMWDFGKGGVVFSSDTVLYEPYSNPGSYSVSLRIVNITDTPTVTKILDLAKGPIAAFEVVNGTGCIPLEVELNDASVPGDGAITDYFWDLRNGQILSGNPAYYTYTTTGNFDIFYQITDANGCTSYYEASQIIQANAQPVANFSASEQFACDPPLTVNFSNLSAGNGTITSSWDLGDGTIVSTFDTSHTYNTPGSYDIKLKITDAYGCTDSTKKASYINIGKPEGKIISVSGNDTISDGDSTICPGDVLISTTLPAQPDYRWLINYNGTEQEYTGSSGINLEFTDSGKVDIRLIYGQTGPCPDTIYRTFYIEYIIPDFQMNKEYTCDLPFNVELVNHSQNAVKYTWIFPDLTTDTNENVQYQIEKPQSYMQTYTHQLQEYKYIFTLIAENVNGCIDTIADTLLAKPPIARFMPDTTFGCTPLEVNFYDSSKSAEEITEWTYLVNGTEIITVTNDSPVTYTFNSSGNYEITSVITNDSGCVDTSYPVKIRVGDIINPDFNISPSPICYGDSIQLTLNTVVPDTSTSWIFSSPGLFNTGETKNSPVSVRILTDTTGSFPVKFELNNNGCFSDSIIQNGIEVNGPVGGFTEEFNCDTPLHYIFFADIADYDDLVWEIEDSVYTNKDTVEHTFKQSGNYPILLTASNSVSGCSVVKRKVIKVREVTAKIDVKSVACVGENITFSSAGSNDYIDSCYNEGFIWYWDDEEPDRKTYNTQYSHIFNDTGRYNVKLEVTGDNGCRATDSTTIRITAPNPEITVSPSSGCGPSMTVILEYHEQTSIDEIASWDWIYGDNTFNFESTDTIVSHTYFSNGSKLFLPQIRVRDIFGCQNYAQEIVKVSVISPEFYANHKEICPENNVNFIFTETLADTFIIYFGDGDSAITQNSSFSHKYMNPGIYDVKLTVKKDGCEKSKTRTDYITVSDINASFSISGDTSCAPSRITFTHSDPSGSVKSGSWNFGDDGATGEYAKVVTYTYTIPGTYIITLNVSSTGCDLEQSDTITVGGPKAEFTFSPTSICSGETVQFKLVDIQDADRYTWTYGDGDTSAVNESDPEHQYFAKGLLTPTLRVTQGGCTVPFTSNDLFVSLVNADFEIDDTDGQFCQNERLNATNLSSFNTRSEWFLDGELLTTDSNLVNLTLNSPGEHTLLLVVSDLANCHDSLATDLTVNSLPSFTIQGDASICYGNSASLSIPNFNQTWSVDWSPNDIFSNSTEPNTTATPDSTTIINSIVTNENGCITLMSYEIYVEGNYTITRIPLGDTSIFLGEHLQLLTTIDKDEVTYTWSPNNHISCTNCQSPVVNPTETTTYMLTTSDTCSEKTENFLIEVITDHYLEFPKAFTPNGDLQNDVFNYEYDKIAEVEFKIFNRWGNLIFSSTKVGEGWDGRTNNKMQNVDTYTFYIRAKTIHGFEFEKKGTFLLLK